MVDLIEIGNRIKQLREACNLTQSHVAAYLDLDQSMIAKMEKGKRSISSDIIEKLSYLFCCSVDYLLFGINAQNVIAYRKSIMQPSDLNNLSIINKIVLNQFELDEMNEDVSHE